MENVAARVQRNRALANSASPSPQALNLSPMRVLQRAEAHLPNLHALAYMSLAAGG